MLKMQIHVHTLYELISDAREACAGSSVKDDPLQVVEMIREAIAWAEANEEDAIAKKLKNARDIMLAAKTYGDRFAADDLFCDLLNNELRDYR